MWLDALDGGPGLRPLILFLGEKTVFVMKIAGTSTGPSTVDAGSRLILRCVGNDVTVAIEPDPRGKNKP